MKVNHPTGQLASSSEQLMTRVISYLSQQIKSGPIIDHVVKAVATNIAQVLASAIRTEFVITANVKGACVRAQKLDSGFKLTYATYLHACAILLGYTDWHAVMAEATQDDLVLNRYFRAFNTKPAEHYSETSIPFAKGLATLAKGTHVTWAVLKRVLHKLSDSSMHTHIDSLLMEMQHAVGITAAADPRGDMLFAVFRDPNLEDSYIIFGEKYRPPKERDGKYLTVMVRVKTYPLSNRVESISTPRDNCYSPMTIKQMVETYRAMKTGIAA